MRKRGKMSSPIFLGILGAGLIMGLSSAGVGIGMGIAGAATIGAWKRCYKANRPAPMTLLAFVGLPLTEVFYGFILMNQMIGVARPENNGLLLGIGVSAGLAMAAVGFAEGYAGAAAADAITDTGKGFAQNIAVIGIVETVALFTMVLSMTVLV